MKKIDPIQDRKLRSPFWFSENSYLFSVIMGNVEVRKFRNRGGYRQIEVSINSLDYTRFVLNFYNINPGGVSSCLPKLRQNKPGCANPLTIASALFAVSDREGANGNIDTRTFSDDQRLNDTIFDFCGANRFHDFIMLLAERLANKESTIRAFSDNGMVARNFYIPDPAHIRAFLSEI